MLNAYTLAFGGLLLLGGRAGDILGRRQVFMAGIALFTAASLAGGLAQSAGWLLAARAAQGVGGAFASPAVLAMITSSFADGRERARALGIYTAVVAGRVAGLVLGGVITESVVALGAVHQRPDRRARSSSPPLFLPGPAASRATSTSPGR